MKMVKRFQKNVCALSLVVLFSFVFSPTASTAAGALPEEGSQASKSTDAAAQRKKAAPILVTKDLEQGDHVWDSLAGPYQVMQDFRIGTSASLTIKPGVTVEFADDASLEVEGKLIAHGTKTSTITLTGMTKTRGSWLRLLIQGEEDDINEDCSFRHVSFEYGGKDLLSGTPESGYFGGILSLYNARARVENCVFRESGTSGAYSTSNSSFQMRETRFVNNQGYAIVEFNNGGSFADLWTDSNLSDLEASGNGYDGVGMADLGVGMADIGIKHDMILEYTGLPYYLVKGGVVLHGGASLTIEPGVTILFDPNSGLALSGGILMAAGTKTKPIILTGIAKESGSWVGVGISGTYVFDLAQPLNPIVWTRNEGSRLSHVTIEYGGTFSGANLALDHAKVALSDCKITHSGKYGISQSASGGSVIERSHIAYNQDSGIHLGSTNEGPILASNNWWGDASGPYHKDDNPTGTGNEVERNAAIFHPFLYSPDQEPGSVPEAYILSLTAAPQRWFAPANGVTKIAVTIALHDGAGNPVPGRKVRLETTLGTVVDGDITNFQGQALAYVSSDEAGDATLTPKMDLAQNYPARSAAAEVTFTEPSTALDLFPDAEAPYVNRSLEMDPLPITVGVPVTMTARVTNPSTRTLSVEMQFGKHNYGIGLPLEIIDTVSTTVPPDSIKPISVSWTPLAPGHQCIGLFGSFDLAPGIQGQKPRAASRAKPFKLPWLRNTNPRPGTLINQQGKDKGKDVEDELAKVRTAMGAFSDGTGGIDNIVSGANFSVGLISGFMLSSFFDKLFDAAEKILKALATDPPRQDYRVYAEPEMIDLPPIEFDQEVSAERANALQTMLDAHLDLLAKGRAAQISYDRYGGAVAAGKQTWASQQAAALLYYYKQTGEAFNVAADSIDALLQVVENEGVEDVYTSRNDFIAHQTRLATQGYTDGEKEASTFLDMTGEDLENLRQKVLAQDPDEVARGTVQQKMADTARGYRELALILINLDSFGEDALAKRRAARGARAAEAPNKLVRVYSTETPIPIANPLDHASSITLRIRRLNLPSDWMVRLSEREFSLDPGEITTVTLTIGAGTAAPEGIEPRVALEAYAADTLLGGVSITTVVPRQGTYPPEPGPAATRFREWILYH